MKIYLMVTSEGSYEDYYETIEGAYLSKTRCQQAIDDYNSQLEYQKSMCRICRSVENEIYDRYYDMVESGEINLMDEAEIDLEIDSTLGDIANYKDRYWLNETWEARMDIIDVKDVDD